ncbi:MAG: hypothetical protein NWR83_03805, partial [Salibacteraceae bacterium]|nr:hypothetical protein [Salibacteraceae bacterium]
MKILLIKILAIFSIAFSVLIFIEYKGYFEPKIEKGEHVNRKWNAFYRLNDKINFDVLLVGNSHLYTGINPKNLSAALAANSFILAAPGTKLPDHYFALKEALEHTKPKIVVLETYGIKACEVKALTDGGLSDQLKSFSSRKDFKIKLQSTPSLFSVENIPYAWFNSLRNHGFLFNNPEQIKINMQDLNIPKTDTSKLYLGRYVRWQTGLKENTLDRYQTDGAPVNGKDFEMNDEAITYLKKIADLCQEKQIKLMLLTLPMYKEHVSNYDVWRRTLDSSMVANELNIDWLDLQANYNDLLFDKNCFEDTYNENQHMSYPGSIAATYQLANFIDANYPDLIDPKSADTLWRELYYNEEGFLENHSPNLNDPKVQILAKDIKVGNLILNELLLIKRDAQYKLLAKVKKDNSIELVDLAKHKLRLLILFKMEGEN